MQVLVAEDDPVTGHLVDQALRRFGYEPLVTRDGVEAWNGYQKNNVSMALLDWLMPGMDGPEVCRRIRAAEQTSAGKYCYIIFLTAKNQTEDLVQGMNSGADDFITKPFDIRELQVRLEAGRRVIRMRDELLTLNQHLATANRLKTEFVNMAVHDFGNPLQILRNYLDLMRDGLLGNLNPEQTNAVNRMTRSVDLLEALRRDMLDLAQFESGRIQLELSCVDLPQLIEECVRNIEFLARSKHQEIVFEIPPRSLVCDARRISQVVTNYLSNAIRYSGEGTRIQVTARSQDNTVTVAVTDQGRGIPEADQERIFEGFYRSGTKVEGSTGLGLAVVRKIVEAHGGRAWCESTPGKGSTFYFTLPLAPGKPECSYTPT